MMQRHQERAMASRMNGMLAYRAKRGSWGVSNVGVSRLTCPLTTYNTESNHVMRVRFFTSHMLNITLLKYVILII